ncbi:hypothetical protein GQ43DRAFT_100301 [Delitschia confertaspora ATCC 74209]|uniref:Uncharacterized protein n=1 Tax=Delitschia confertaspora ATCC 74209 TaxID=1513339 RepID=A0A9P4MNT2_9PLEO|nr:hypothetical protein GQ43DRAFT_100301 [Delitschia confertaspora ATCC 74209]
MCSSHTCCRNALIHAFRPSVQRTAFTWSVPEYLAPAFLVPASRRNLSPAKRPRFKRDISFRRPYATFQTTFAPLYPPEILRDTFRGCIPRPDQRLQHDIQQWLTLLEPYIPLHLRKEPSDKTNTALPASATDLSSFLIDGQKASHDLLSYLALNERRWNTATWLIHTLVENGPSALDSAAPLELSTNVIWPDPHLSLEEVTNRPLFLDRVRPSRTLRQSLDEITSPPVSIEYEHTLVKSAFGQVWRSLGNMILAATEVDNEQEASEIMTHVLEIIAYLHHKEMIPESIYLDRPAQSPFALQQPPMLHLLSSQIFTALSDASWNAREASTNIERDKMNASYFFGREIPGSRFKVAVAGMSPEVWLELVLWSCLHGGWLLDGMAILEKIMGDSHGKHPWKLICWQEFMNASKKSETSTQKSWNIFGGTRSDRCEPDYRKLTQKRISSEVVTAFVDGLVSSMRVGVGLRGTDPATLLAHIKNLKQLLDTNNLSLGAASWDSIIIRLLESEGINPEKRPELLLQLLDLSANFGQEVGSFNVSPPSLEANGNPPYFFLASAAPIGLLHRAIRSFIERGNVSGVISTLTQLQHYTDNNKKRSMTEFFGKLKKIPPVRLNTHFESIFAPIEFPGFHPQIPLPLLAQLLEFSTDTGASELGRWLLFAKDIDGPLISPNLYHNSSIAASVVRFGNMVGNDNLVMKVVKISGQPDERGVVRLTAEVLTAFIISQIQMHRWETVKKMQTYVLENPGYRPRPEILASFATELLRCSTQTKREMAQLAFTDLLYAWEGLIVTNLRAELNNILIMLSTVHDDWKVFCSQFIMGRGRERVCLSTREFNRILGGVLDGYGSLQGKRMVEMWCYGGNTQELIAYHSPGGLPTMPRYKVDKGKEYSRRPENIEIHGSSEETLVFLGRVKPNIQTVRAVLRKAQEEEDQRQKARVQLTDEGKTELREVIGWAVNLLRYLGLDYEEIVDNLGSLGQIEHDPPSAPTVLGFEDKLQT